MKKMITDRKQSDTTRLITLSSKGWDNMTTAEKAEWSGNPLTATACGYTDAVNLLPPVSENLVFRDGSIIASNDGVVVIGDAADFSGVAVTLSVEYMSDGGELSLRWSNGSSAGCGLTEAGSVTATLTTSTNTQLVLNVGAGYYGKVMLELGRVRHDYVPYTEIIPTSATKGAYNCSDLNRVERMVAEIAEMVGVTLSIKTDWTMEDCPTSVDTARYMNNIRVLRDVFGITTVIPTNMEKFTYTTANTIEALLLDLRSRAETFGRCGELMCGEVS